MEVEKTFMRVTLLTALIAATLIGPSNAESLKPSAEEFSISCAPCHGEDGRGGGYLMKDLEAQIEAPDLTQLSKKNDGVFPLPLVFSVIDGTGADQWRAHGDPRTMPIWGKRYMEQAEEEYGLFGRGPAVRARILELVYYLQSIQEK